MNSKKQLIYGVLLGVLAVVMFSSKAIMIKLIYQHNVDALTALFFRMLFAFPFYIIIAYSYSRGKRVIKNTNKEYVWILFFGFVGYYLASYFDFVGLTYIKASLERIILFIYPTIVLFFNYVFLKQKMTRNQKTAILITYLGILFIFGSEVSISGNNTYLGGFFILLSAITYASYLVGSGWLIPRFGIVRFTAYAMLVSCLCVFIHFGLTLKADVQLFNYPKEVYIMCLCIAVFATVIPSFLVSTAIKMIGSSNFAIVAGVGPISTLILAYIFLGEHLTPLQIIGTVIVISGIIFVSKGK